MPAPFQLTEIHAKYLIGSLFRVACIAQGKVEFAHLLTAPFVGNKLQKALAHPVGEIALRILQRPHPVVDHHIQDKHIVKIIFAADGEEFRQPFRKPEGEGMRAHIAQQPRGRPIQRIGISVRKLMHQKLFQLGIAAFEGHHHPVSQAFGKTANAFREQRIDDIGI